MKKILLVALLLTGMSAMQAQESKFYAGGTLGLTWSKVSDDGGSQSGVSAKIMPEVGYNLNDKWSVGVALGYSHGYAAFGGIDFNDLKSIANTVASTAADVASDGVGAGSVSIQGKLNSFRFAPYARYNFWETGKFKFFVEGSLGYIHVGLNRDSSSDMTLNVVELNIRPGFSFDASKKITLLAKVGSLGFIYGKEKESGTKISRVGFDMDSYNVLLGMNYNF